MCAVNEARRQERRANRKAHTAVVYLQKGGRVFLSKPDTAEVLGAIRDGMPIMGTDTDGRQVVLPASSYLNATGPRPASERVEVPSDVFDGKQVMFRCLANLVRDVGHDALTGTGPEIEPDEGVAIGMSMCRSEDYPHVVVVEAEDLVRATVLVMDLRREDDDLLWINPASDPAAIDLYVRMVRAAAEAEQREILFNQPDAQIDRDVAAGWDSAMAAKERPAE